MQRSFKKRLIGDPVDAYVYLGLGQIAMNQTAPAQRAFADLQNLPGISPRVAEIWQLFAQTRTLV